MQALRSMPEVSDRQHDSLLLALAALMTLVLQVVLQLSSKQQALTDVSRGSRGLYPGLGEAAHPALALALAAWPWRRQRAW